MKIEQRNGLTFEIFRRLNLWKLKKQWYFRLKEANGEIIAQSKGYDSLTMAASAIRVMRIKCGVAKIEYLDAEDYYGA